MIDPDELIEFDAIEPPEEDEVVPVMPPDNAEQANWQLRKLAQLRRQIAEVEQLAAAEIERTTRWRDRRVNTLDKQAQWYEAALATWHRALLEQDPQRKTISLPGGALKARKQPDQWVVDADIFLPWARENAPHLVRVKEEPAKSELKRWAITAIHTDHEVEVTAVARDSGERIPGVTVTRGGVSFTVDTEAQP